VLPVICIALVLRLGHATGGACVLIWTCWGLQQRLVATWAEFQHSVVYYATEQCRKRLEAYINGEGGHSEQLLWHCLPDNPVATHHNRFFSEPPTFEKNATNLQSEEKKFCNLQVSVVTFSGGWASGLQFVFFWDNVNNQKYVWIDSTVENDFFRFPKVKWLHLTGEVDKSVRFSCQIFSGFTVPNSVRI